MRTGSSSPSFSGAVAPRPQGRAYLLLVLATLTWGANAVAARLAVGEVSPMMLTFSRWIVCCLALALSSRREISTHWRALRPSWRSIALMGTLGFTGFNALFYAAAHHTTAINIAIIQGTIPVLVLLGGFIFFGSRIGLLQIVGVLVTLTGIVVVASRGQFALLAGLAFNIGDLWIVLACLLYAGYALALRNRPAVPAIVFFAAMAAVAALTSVPLVVAEIVTGHFFMPTATGVALIIFIGLLPSFVSQIFFIQAVEAIGPARAGLFLNLVPIFGPLLAVLVLGEPLSAYHALALALVLGGIYIAESFGPGKQR
ncbi:DMT family transporter [Variovorax ginsengisoli]|uniref:DMT family transporter n=1 Tax=Variovorax ginsengisoli TaxID=363844 RepID=A0ABT8S3A3_9BURK|nr:DMT family transporter [Variovorax ginsengisoli]MDN8614239.1 DMT family transporter [Variovorax ginsengisoli]MDO1533409.1 DMT family transporter [Variovorax ginsengisoli]